VRAYNERPTLGDVLAPLEAEGYSIVVVDDGSTDGTASIAGRHAVTLVSHAVNLGPGAALQTGFTAALRGGARYLVTVDADGQHPIDELPNLLAPLWRGEADVVFAYLTSDQAPRLQKQFERQLKYGARVVTISFDLPGWQPEAFDRDDLIFLYKMPPVMGGLSSFLGALK